MRYVILTAPTTNRIQLVWPLDEYFLFYWALNAQFPVPIGALREHFVTQVPPEVMSNYLAYSYAAGSFSEEFTGYATAARNQLVANAVLSHRAKLAEASSNGLDLGFLQVMENLLIATDTISATKLELLAKSRNTSKELLRLNARAYLLKLEALL